jgi:hypothetical protein
MATSPAPVGAHSADPNTDRIASRRLCAGIYHDRDFRDYVLRNIYNARDRRVAPSHGFDLVPVLRHAWRAWWLETCQYLLTLAVLGCWLVLRPLDTCIALDALVIGYLLRHRLSWIAEFNGYGHSGHPAPDRPEQVRDRNLQLRGLLLKRSLRWALAVFVALILLSAVGGRTDAPTSWAVRTGFTVIGILSALIVVPAVIAGVRAWYVARLRSPAACGLGRPGRRTRAIDQQQRHPVTVHSGFKPFLGSGKNVRSWSFAQRLVPVGSAGIATNREFGDPPFTARKLVDRLRDKITALRYDNNPETRLPGLRVTDCVFVEGTRATRIMDALAGQPGSIAVTRAIDDAITNSSDVARHYLCAQVVSWDGEIVTSVFVHVSLQGRTLYLEFATYALFPVRPEYAVDLADRGRAGSAGNGFGTVITRLPGQALETWRLAGAPSMLWPALRARVRPAPPMNPRGDIGAESSVRETAMIDRLSESGDEPESGYFQSQDIIQHSKIIERRLIATIEEYLAEVGVDSSEFVQRTTAILNYGIMNTGGGTINASNVAVGENASVLAQAGNP